jgi:hypothetical protein
MQPSTDNLFEVIGMMPPLIGFYDVPDAPYAGSNYDQTDV